MSFNFDIKNTEVYRAVKKDSLALLGSAKILKSVFLFFLIVSLALVFFAYFDAVSGRSAGRVLVLFLCLYLIFWNIDLFVRLKIRKQRSNLSIAEIIDAPENYNLAEFLSFDLVKIFLDAINCCQKKKIAINSTAILFSALKLDKMTSSICFRLSFDVKKLQLDAKNYLEKIPKQEMPAKNDFSDDFQKTINHALKIANERGHDIIDSKEILVALSRQNDFFKNSLVEFDLKPEDVENLTLWLDSAESLAERNRKFWTHENLLKQGSFGKDFSSGYTITLDQYSIDWRRHVSRWKFIEIIGHKKEIDQAEVALAKSNLTNVLLVGDPDADRKSIVQAIAHKCYLGTSLSELNYKRVVELDLVSLVSRINDFEKLELTLDQIFSEVVSSGNVILVIDNLENFVGQKVQKAGSFDISGVLAKYLPMPRFQFIGLTSYEGLHKNIEENSAFASLFEKIEVVEITQTETTNILQSAALDLEYSQKVLILYPSLREIVNLTARYMPSLPFPKKAIDVLYESVAYVCKLKEKVVLPHHIAEIISKRTEIPVGKMEVQEKEVLLNLEKLIHERIVNQEEAVKEVSIAMRRARAGIASKTRPMGTFLFLGPTGVGKTETAKAMTSIYFGSDKKMIRIDMSEFQAISDIPRLIGAVSPVEMQGLLTTPVRETPFSLVLLDEIEKAHPNILNLFLQVLDEGRITDGQGRKVVFTNTIIICTSNAGADIIFKKVALGEKLNKDELLHNLFDRNIFRPEFVNRFDATVLFGPLTKDNLLKIAQLSLQGLQKNLKERDIDFIITESLKEKIVDLSYKPEFGAREMRRVVQDKVENVIAEALLSDKVKKGDRIEISPQNFEIIINPVK